MRRTYVLALELLLFAVVEQWPLHVLLELLGHRDPPVRLLQQVRLDRRPGFLGRAERRTSGSASDLQVSVARLISRVGQARSWYPSSMSPSGILASRARSLA